MSWTPTVDELPPLNTACLGVYVNWQTMRWNIKSFTARRRNDNTIVMPAECDGLASRRKLMRAPMMWQLIDIPGEQEVAEASEKYMQNKEQMEAKLGIV